MFDRNCSSLKRERTLSVLSACHKTGIRVVPRSKFVPCIFADAGDFCVPAQVDRIMEVYEHKEDKGE